MVLSPNALGTSSYILQYPLELNKNNVKKEIEIGYKSVNVNCRKPRKINRLIMNSLKISNVMP